MDALSLSALLIGGINAAGLAFAFARQSDKLTDLLYSVSFAAAALAVFFLVDPGNRTAASMTMMVLIWSVRLGGYLFLRIHRMDRDERFDQMRPNLWRLGGFWLLQAVTVWIVLLPLFLVVSQSSDGLPDSILQYIGSGIWLLGLLMESLADWQKYTFRNNPMNKGRFIQTGLWKYSRHPNYLGEKLVWIGFYLFSLTVLSDWRMLIALASPLWISFLLLRVSGIPLLEKSADKRYGLQAAYQEYKRKTPLLLPRFW